MLYQGNLITSNERYAIVVSRFNDFITKQLLDGAMDALDRHGVDHQSVDIVWVPGAFEIAIALQTLANTNKYAGLIALGAVIRGDTTHYDYVCSAVTNGINKVQLDCNIPISFGIITTENLEQAIARCGVKHTNKGYEAATTTIEMVNLLSKLK